MAVMQQREDKPMTAPNRPAPNLKLFDREIVALMQSVLKLAVARLPSPHRNSSNQTAIASRILAAGAEGGRSESILLAAALDEVEAILRSRVNAKAA
jgi:hypothetical protein